LIKGKIGKELCTLKAQLQSSYNSELKKIFTK